MATTKIHHITSSPDRCVRYGVNNKTGELKDDIADGITYAVNDKTGKVTYHTLSSFLNCNELNAIDRFHFYADMGRGKHRKEKPRTKNGDEVVAWHLHQNFEGFEVSPRIANEIGCKLAHEIFSRFACTISTHTNTDNIHNHIVICAWDKDGRKWNNCNSNYRLIRQISDRLCKEYNLSVLRDTQEVKLISFTDKDGVKRYYEPTDRKNQIIMDRELGKAVGKIDDYRNTPNYSVAIEYDETNRAAIKQDIDTLLPSVRSYEELIDSLRSLGYQISDKKKNGEWLKHITFTAPLQGKGTRDYKLGDGEYYTREKLTKCIELQNQTNNDEKRSNDNDEKRSNDEAKSPQAVVKRPHGEESAKTAAYHERYYYAELDVDDIDDNERTYIGDQGGYNTVPRSAAEKSVIADIRKRDSEIKGLIDTTELQRIIADQESARLSKKTYKAKSREEALVEQIREGFENLRFMERHGIYSYEQINGLYKAVHDSINRNLTQLAKAERLTEHFYNVLEAPEKAAVLEARIADNADNEEYLFEEYDDDTNYLAQLKDTMQRYKIEDGQGQSTLRKKIDEANERVNSIKDRLELYRLDLSNYERCIKVLDRIDTENNRSNEKALTDFEAIKAAGAAAQSAAELVAQSMAEETRRTRKERKDR